MRKGAWWPWGGISATSTRGLWDAGPSGLSVTDTGQNDPFCPLPYWPRRGWVLAPLTDANKIAERLDAVEYLMARPDACMVLRTGLRRCRDLVQCLGALRRAHAEPPAALPVDVVARAQGRRLRALLGCVEVLRGGHDALTRFSSALSEGEASDAPPLLRRLVEARVRVEESGALDALAEVGGAVLADKKGRLRLCDSAVAEMAAMDGIDANPAGDGGDLEAEVRRAAPRAPACKCGGRRVEIEARRRPEAGRSTPGFPQVRCTTAFVTRLLSLSREWKALDAAVSTLDVLISFAAFSSGLPGTVCRPDVLPLSATTPGAEPFLVLEVRPDACPERGGQPP